MIVHVHVQQHRQLPLTHIGSSSFVLFLFFIQCSPDMVKEGGGAVILLLTSAQYLSGMPTAFNSASLRCLISSSFLRLHMI